MKITLGLIFFAFITAVPRAQAVTAGFMFDDEFPVVQPRPTPPKPAPPAIAPRPAPPVVTPPPSVMVPPITPVAPVVTNPVDRKTEAGLIGSCPTCKPNKNVEELQAVARTRASQLQKGALQAARRCRTMADFKGGGWSCSIFGSGENNFRRSKGMCSAGVQEAFNAAGITLGRGDAIKQPGNVLRAGLKRTKFDPSKLPGGAVITCGASHHQWGHIEIIVMKANGQREFCSDFCSPRPTCGRGSYSNNMQAFKWPGT